MAYESDIHRNLVNEREVMSDLIKALKENKEPFGLMSEEMQAAMRRLNASDFEFYAVITETEESLWDRCEDYGSTGDFWSGTVYRLRPDYEESGVVECEVFIEDGHLHFRRDLDGPRHSLAQALDEPDFIGFKYEDGSIHSIPRSFKGERDGDIWGSVLSSEKLSDFKVLTPTHVVFKKKCGSAAPK